ncbi:MAG: type 2 isopentenyl-diphosphate Delta-isomerase [Desulfurococcales archaeon ex4484_58]|nr:MAG: type 2 isopentenyl-diphosphate Delta-isomerase [Desulfurococcales archaeon ex4484_58]
MDSEINNRKLEHIDIVLNKNPIFIGKCNEIYESIILIHQALPCIDYDEINLKTRFLKYELNVPLMITGMTGGHPSTKDINEKLAKIASTYKIAIGVGSQRPMLLHKTSEVIETYKVAREYASDIPLIGNIGANTLSDLTIEDIEWIVSSIEADALAIHLNPAQEIIQPEGDTRFNKRILNKIEEILDRIDIPIIIKEVGHGLSIETVSYMSSIGIRFYDVAGACGTNWALVEMYRERTPEIKHRLALKLAKWGIPTPLSVIETIYTSPDSYVIASGGVWDGVKAVKNLVLGANLVGIARPILKALIEKGVEGVKDYLREYIETMKTIMFLIGARDLVDLKRKPVILNEPIKSYLIQRNIDIDRYLNHIRKNR